MLSVFVILIAGCDHGGEVCRPLEERRIEAADRAACEAALALRLRGQTADWPVYTGVCRAAGPVAGELSG